MQQRPTRPDLQGEASSVRLGSLTAADVAAVQSAFGLDLLHAVCAQQPGGNVLLSPTSAAEALSMLYPATRGPTTEQAAAVPHLPRWSPELVAAFPRPH